MNKEVRIRIGNQTAFSSSTIEEPFQHTVASRFDAFEWFPDKKDSGAGWMISDISKKRRHTLKNIAHDHDIVIVEDDPYGKLAYDIDNIKPIKAYDDEGRVIYLSTFSKILSPGFRLAWTVASDELTRKMIICKQALDLCTNTFTQYIASEFLRQGSLDFHDM